MRGLKPIVSAAEALDQELTYAADFADIMGQEHVKRAMEVAAAGGHHALMCGTKSRNIRAGASPLGSASRGGELALTRRHPLSLPPGVA